MTNEERDYQNNLKQVLLEVDDAQLKQLADRLKITRVAVSIRLQAMGKIQKMEKLISHKLNERQQET